ncbi:hypothetical protein A3Q40_01096 [Rhodococcus sp. PBTS 1]|nr:hypothetical protein A3Q40_01096 [Rhodococcus sp. PBTS 1]
MVHVDVKKVGRIPDGGGWRAHGRGLDQTKAVSRAKAARTGYIELHSAIDGYSRLAYPEALPDEKPSRQQHLSIGPGRSSPSTVSTASTDWSPTTGPATEPTPSPEHCSGAGISAAPRVPRPQRKSRALQQDPRGGVALHPNLGTATRGSPEGLKRLLQLPSTAHCRREPTTSIATESRCHQRRGFAHLARSPRLMATARPHGHPGFQSCSPHRVRCCPEVSSEHL